MNNRALLAVLLVAFATTGLAQPVEPVLAQVKAHKQPLLDTLKDLTSIESGSRDIEGLDKITALIESRLKAMGADSVLHLQTPCLRLADMKSSRSPSSTACVLPTSWLVRRSLMRDWSST